MDYFIAFLKYFTDVRVKKCPFCTQQWPVVQWPRYWPDVCLMSAAGDSYTSYRAVDR